MKISDLLKLSTDNLRRRKGRTALTVIGVVVGTCAIVAVSYTHLDVYKRQLQSAFCEKQQIYLVYIIHKFHPHAMAAGLTFRKDSGIPVSYTHLDVYKRQPVHREPVRRSAVCTPTRTVEIDTVHVIGERINPTGKKRFKEALRDGDMDYILSQAVDVYKRQDAKSGKRSACDEHSV